MVNLRLDPQARLVWLAAVPPDRDEAASAADEEIAPPEAVWNALFEEAGLDPARFTEVAPSRTPPFFADARAAWVGTFAEAEDLPLRVEAAAFRGRPVSFRIVGPWTRDRGAVKPPEVMDRVFPYLAVAIILFLLVGLGLLARRNLNSGRSDLRGARRIGLVIFVLELATSVLGGGMFFAGEVEERFFLSLAIGAFLSVIVFLAYVALEPYVRRLWPTTLISWTRLLAGRFGDPLVGRDLLLGGTLGVFARFLWTAHTMLPGLLGLPEEPLGAGAARGALGAVDALARLPNEVGGAVGVSMLLLLGLVLLRLVLRSGWAAIGVYVVISTVLPHLGSPHVVLDIGVHAVVTALTLFVLLRVGLLASVSMRFFYVVARSVSTLDPSSWLWGASVVCLVAMAVVTVYAVVAALRGRVLLPDEI
jgi:hypothetical protein